MVKTVEDAGHHRVIRPSLRFSDCGLYDGNRAFVGFER